MTDGTEAASDRSTVIGGAVVFWLGVSLYISYASFGFSGVVGGALLLVGVFSAGAGVILIAAGVSRVLARLLFRRNPNVPGT